MPGETGRAGLKPGIPGRFGGRRAQSYDRESTSVLGLQQDLATAIAEQIRVRLTTTEKGRSPHRQALEALKDALRFSG
ncbi:MAG: hypothetical protein ABIS06_04385 [Vicinamibacterales bacterium]